MDKAEAEPAIQRFVSKFKVYCNRHPVITAHGILAILLGGLLVPKFYSCEDKFGMGSVCKYRTNYIVVRSDDPQVHMIKRRTTGLDDWTKVLFWNNDKE